MKKAGIYCMFTATAAFFLVVAFVLSARQSASVITQYHQVTLISNPTIVTEETISFISNGKLNINIASSKELEMLPGIGKVLAERIIAYRTANGHFKTVDELIEVKGIGPSKLDAIKSYITVN